MDTLVVGAGLACNHAAGKVRSNYQKAAIAAAAAFVVYSSSIHFLISISLLHDMNMATDMIIIKKIVYSTIIINSKYIFIIEH